MKPISTILVPVDFGDVSLNALDQAIELARKLEASVVLLHAYEVPRLVGPPPDALVVTPNESAQLAETWRAALEGVMETRQDCGVPLHAVLREGPTARVIDDVADEIGADLIVIGTHGKRGILRLLLGSVAETVVRTAHTPVLTIRAPDHELGRSA